MSAPSASSSSVLGGGDVPPGNGRKNNGNPNKRKRPAPSESQECIICMNDLTDENRATGNACNHEFCFDCLSRWTEINPTCPLCKVLVNTIHHNFRHNVYNVHLVPLNRQNQIHLLAAREFDVNPAPGNVGEQNEQNVDPPQLNALPGRYWSRNYLIRHPELEDQISNWILDQIRTLRGEWPRARREVALITIMIMIHYDVTCPHIQEELRGMFGEYAVPFQRKLYHFMVGIEPYNMAQAGTQRPNQSAERPDQSGERPNQSAQRPNQSAQRTNQSAQRPNQSAQRPNQSAQRPNQSAQRPNQSAQRPNQSAQRPNKRAQRPNQSAQRPNKRAQRPNQSAQRLNQSAQRPNQSAERQNAPPEVITLDSDAENDATPNYIPIRERRNFAAPDFMRIPVRQNVNSLDFSNGSNAGAEGYPVDLSLNAVPATRGNHSFHPAAQSSISTPNFDILSDDYDRRISTLARLARIGVQPNSELSYVRRSNVNTIMPPGPEVAMNLSISDGSYSDPSTQSQPFTRNRGQINGERSGGVPTAAPGELPLERFMESDDIMHSNPGGLGHFGNPWVPQFQSRPPVKQPRLSCTSSSSSSSSSSFSSSSSSSSSTSESGVTFVSSYEDSTGSSLTTSSGSSESVISSDEHEQMNEIDSYDDVPLPEWVVNGDSSGSNYAPEVEFYTAGEIVLGENNDE